MSLGGVRHRVRTAGRDVLMTLYAVVTSENHPGMRRVGSGPAYQRAWFAIFMSRFRRLHRSKAPLMYFILLYFIAVEGIIGVLRDNCGTDAAIHAA